MKYKRQEILLLEALEGLLLSAYIAYDARADVSRQARGRRGEHFHGGAQRDA
jgi:hypothetical protein